MMKQILFLLLLVCVGKSNVLWGQSPLVKVDVTSPFFQTYSVSYEYAANKNRSWQWSFFYTHYNGGGSVFNGIGLSPEYRIFLKKSLFPAGVYIAPSVRLEQFRITDAYNQQMNHLSYGGAFVLGKQLMMGDRFIIDGYIGPSYTLSAISRYVSSSHDVSVILGTNSFTKGSVEGLGIRAGIQIGYTIRK